MLKKVLLMLTMVLVIQGSVLGFLIKGQANGMEGLKEIIREAMVTGSADKYDIAVYEMSVWELIQVYYEVAREEAIAYYSYYNLGCGYTENSDEHVTDFYLENVDDDFLVRYERNKEAVDSIISELDDSMTDLEKVLYVHDYIIYTTRYDGSINKAKDSDYPYGVLVKKVGVCDGYTKTFIMIMHVLDINCEYVLSQSMNHSWAMVEIDHLYYHVDLSWDDPLEDQLGKVYHDFLIRSDDEFESGLYADHFDWDNYWSTNKSADSDLYLYWPIHDVIGKINYVAGEWFYVDSNYSLVKSDIWGNNKRVLVNCGNSKTDYVRAMVKGEKGWYYSQGDRIMHCDDVGLNRVEIVDFEPAINDDNTYIQYMHLSEEKVLTATIFNYDTNGHLTITTETINFNEMKDYQRVEYIEGLVRLKNETGQLISLGNTWGLGFLNSRIYGLQIWNGDKLIRDYMPVVDGDRTPCLYDYINKEFDYTFRGYIAGPIVEEVNEYIAVDYIEVMENNKGIDTRLYFNQQTKISLDMAITSSSGYRNYIKSYTAGNNRIVLRQESLRGLYMAYGWYNSRVYKPEPFVKFSFVQDRHKTYINNSLVRTATRQNFVTQYPIKIGAGVSRIYGCKIWEGDALMRDYIPVLDSEGKGCLYDLVNEKFYYFESDIVYGE